MLQKRGGWFGISGSPSKAEADAWTPDKDTVKAKFDHYDPDKNGALDENEIMVLAQDLWTAFHPKSMPLDFAHVQELTRELIRKADQDTGNKNGVVEFEEFFPWYTAVAQKHYRAVHGIADPAPSIAKKEAPARVTRSAPPAPANPKRPPPGPPKIAASCALIPPTGGDPVYVEAVYAAFSPRLTSALVEPVWADPSDASSPLTNGSEVSVRSAAISPSSSTHWLSLFSDSVTGSCVFQLPPAVLPFRCGGASRWLLGVQWTGSPKLGMQR